MKRANHARRAARFFGKGGKGGGFEVRGRPLYIYTRAHERFQERRFRFVFDSSFPRHICTRVCVFIQLHMNVQCSSAMLNSLHKLLANAPSNVCFCVCVCARARARVPCGNGALSLNRPETPAVDEIGKGEEAAKKNCVHIEARH